MLQANEEQVRVVVAERLRAAEQRRLVRAMRTGRDPIKVWSFGRLVVAWVGLRPHSQTGT